MSASLRYFDIAPAGLHSAMRRACRPVLKARSAPPTSSANAVSSHFIEGRFNEVRPERAKTRLPALTSEGDRDRLLPGLLAVARSNIASYT
jgi:hypothetical protein